MLVCGPEVALSVDTATVKEVLSGINDPCAAEKCKEFQNWIDKDVYCVAENEVQLYLTCRRVLTDENGRKKARLVISGYEDPDYYKVIKDSQLVQEKHFVFCC